MTLSFATPTAATTQVSRSEYDDSAGGVVSSYAWQYDAVGQLVSQTDHGRTVDYTHDAQGNRDGAGNNLGATCDCDRRNPPERCSQMP